MTRTPLPLPVSVGYVNYQRCLMDTGALRDFCGALEELGYAGVQVQDHVAYPWDESAYGYSAGGTVSHHPGQQVLESLAVLATAAGCSTHLQLETSLIVLTQRHPLLVAKQAATIDALSGGRLLLGLGPGWLEAEIEALGWDASTRGARLDEALEVLTRAFDDERVSFDGEHFRFAEVSLEPRPQRRAREILWIGGGESGALRNAMRRLGRYGRGWLVNPRLPLDEIPGALALAREEARAAGRGNVDFGLDLIMLHRDDAEATAAAVRRRVEAGATRLTAFLGGLDQAPSVEALIGLAEEVATIVRSTAPAQPSSTPIPSASAEDAPSA